MESPQNLHDNALEVPDTIQPCEPATVAETSDEPTLPVNDETLPLASVVVEERLESLPPSVDQAAAPILEPAAPEMAQDEPAPAATGEKQTASPKRCREEDSDSDEAAHAPELKRSKALDADGVAALQSDMQMSGAPEVPEASKSSEFPNIVAPEPDELVCSQAA